MTDGMKETRILLDSNFYFRVYEHSVECFHELVEIVAFPRQGVEVYYRTVFDNYRFEGLSCVRVVCLAEAATCTRCSMSLSS